MRLRPIGKKPGPMRDGEPSSSRDESAMPIAAAAQKNRPETRSGEVRMRMMLVSLCAAA